MFCIALKLTPVFYFQVLQLAREENKKVRVVGSKHSPSDIACTNGFMVSLQNFNYLVEVLYIFFYFTFTYCAYCMLDFNFGLILDR